MIDGETVLTQVRQGISGSEWQIFHGRPGFFLGRGLFFNVLVVLLALIIVAFVIKTFTSSTLTQSGYMDYISNFGFLAVIYLFAMIVVLSTSISYFKQAYHAPQQLLVLLPTGVVMCKNSGSQPTRVIQYADTVRIELHTWQTRHRKGIYFLHTGLILHYKDGGRSEWELNERFGADDMIAQMIIAGQARYAALHDNASA